MSLNQEEKVVAIESELIVTPKNSTEVIQDTKKKKEKLPGFFQYTIKIAVEPVSILYSKHLIKESNDKLFIKDAFIEGKIEETFLGFPIIVSYKEPIGNFEFDFTNEDWMVVFEYTNINDAWTKFTIKDALYKVQEKKNELISSLDTLQKEGKIQIKKK